MVTQLSINKKKYRVDLSKPFDISIPLRAGRKNVNAFHIPDVLIEPFRIGDFVGAVRAGGSCNVNNIAFNPHGNGTHTECVGHISRQFVAVNDCLREFFFIARLVSVKPERRGNDLVVTRSQVEKSFRTSKRNQPVKALIIRTLPNPVSKLNRKYSGTNPPYLEASAALWIREKGIDHLLLDLPSVDREMDGGQLAAHHAFWNYPKKARKEATITELIYVPAAVKDGDYLLNLMIASFQNDASPSKPVLYRLVDAR